MISGNGDVIHEIEVAAPPDLVFAMFVEAERLVQWLGISADLDARPGGRFRFEVVPGQFCEGEYVEVVPPRRVVVTWGWTDPVMGVPPGGSRVEVDLEPTADGTRVRLAHRGLSADARLLHDDGWGRFLARLTDVTAGRSPASYPDEDPLARKAALERKAQP